MKTFKASRIAAAAGVAAFATLGPIAAATPASAMYSGCINYVKSKGYVAGPKVYNACSKEALHGGMFWIPNPGCIADLVAIRVTQSVAAEACTRAHG